jgi:ABC-type tungstate transport system substrate-binding protein
MTTTLTKEQSAMVQESARGLNGAAASTFETNVIARLDAMAATGVTITTPNVQTAISQELGKGK